MRTYAAIVVGLGAMGSAAAYHLSRRGYRVLGLDVFARGHTLGSSHGESRVIRMAYLEHPDYVPLLRRAYELWRELERESDSHVVAGSLESARLHSLPHEMLDANEIRRRYPVLRPEEGHVALFEGTAGMLYPERCIEAHLSLATAAGAELHHDEPVLRWTATGDGVEVETSRGCYGASRLVLRAGAWLGRLLGGLGLPLQPERRVVVWLQAREGAERFEADRVPSYICAHGRAGGR